MAIGFSVGRADINEISGTLAVSLRNVIDEITRFQEFLSITSDSTLMADPINFTNQEVAVLKSAFADLAQLGRIYHGAEDLAVAKDFTTFADQLTGLR